MEKRTILYGARFYNLRDKTRCKYWAIVHYTGGFPSRERLIQAVLKAHKHFLLSDYVLEDDITIQDFKEYTMEDK